jgi:hypothetical protein
MLLGSISAIRFFRRRANSDLLILMMIALRLPFPAGLFHHNQSGADYHSWCRPLQLTGAQP